ncbi:hypothetical protein H4219_004924 [Mycoemilia scoparia]|uniref:F-box domain-containing protein n=1 Tax=Mycoemilia scoparia TaxID=417184 RepID=A0A9W7ZUT0_9FUNG|nr:hypothetical protein H4219_004924 [Mycoemilia scoparia]
MIPPELKTRICQYITKKSNVDDLVQLEAVSREWFEAANNYRWEHHDFFCPIPEEFKRLVIRCYISSEAKEAEKARRAKSNSLFLSVGHQYTRALSIDGDLALAKSLHEVSCPELSSLQVEIYPETLDVLPKFINHNSNISEMTIHGPAREIATASLSAPALMNSITATSGSLTRLQINLLLFRIPSFGYLLDQMPNLRQLKMSVCFIEDVSEIFVDRKKKQELNTGEQYPNLKELSISRLYISVKDVRIVTRSVFNTRMFPRLAIIKQSYIQISQGNRDEFIPKDAVEVPPHILFQMPIPSLVDLCIFDFNAHISRTIGANCTNLRLLHFEAKIFISAHRLPVIWDGLSKLSKHLPRLTEFSMQFDVYTTDDKEMLDSVFFGDPRMLNEYSQEDDSQRSIFRQAAALPIDFGWKDLRKINLKCWNGFSPKIFIMLAQFKQLEHLKLYMSTLKHMDGCASFILQELLQGTGGNGNEQVKRSVLFPKLKSAHISISHGDPSTRSQCQGLVDLVSTARLIEIQGPSCNRDVWAEISQNYPQIAWKIYC